MCKTALILCLILAPALQPARAAEEVDRLVAAVNGRIITEGDLKLAANLNALLLFGQAAHGQPRDQEVRRLIDLELLGQELENFPVAPADEKGIGQSMEEFKQAYAEIGGLSSLLSRLGLQQSELESYLRLQASILRFVDLRFRPFTPDPEPEEIETYYRERLEPTLRASGAAVPPLAEVSAKIGTILKEEKVNAALDQWVRDVRLHSRIEFFGADEDTAAEVRQ